MRAPAPKSRYQRSRDSVVVLSARQPPDRILKMKFSLPILAAAISAAQATASLPSAAPPLILRTNTYRGTIATGPRSTEFVQYASLNDLSSGITSGMPNIDFADHAAMNDIFWDGTRFYLTNRMAMAARTESSAGVPSRTTATTRKPCSAT